MVILSTVLTDIGDSLRWSALKIYETLWDMTEPLKPLGHDRTIEIWNAKLRWATVTVKPRQSPEDLQEMKQSRCKQQIFCEDDQLRTKVHYCAFHMTIKRGKIVLHCHHCTFI